MNLFTIIILIIFALFILKGYRRGFIRSLASAFSLVISIVIVNMATPYVTEFLETQTPVYDYILKRCEDVFSVEDMQLTAVQEEQQNEVIDNLALPKVLRNFLKENNTPEYYGKMAVKSFSEYIQKYMASLILNICSFVVTLILVMSFVSLIVMTLDLVARLPIIKGVNQILGLGLGFFQGLIIVWIIFLIITIFSQSYIGRELMQMIVDSPILSRIYDTNVLLNFLQNTISKII
ncbi:MAG: CvpA family protein [Eubacteriales bacterium]|nr:CvpA family protein [Eubacteriales bacterium]